MYFINKFYHFDMDNKLQLILAKLENLSIITITKKNKISWPDIRASNLLYFSNA